jgi:hypothetical protein
MKWLSVFFFFLFCINPIFAQGDYKEVSEADFEQRQAAIGQYTKVSFKYLPLKTTTIYDYDMGNNFFWYVLVEKKGKIFLTDELVQKGFTLTINRKLEDLNGIKAEIFTMKDGKIQHSKIGKKSIVREEKGDTTFYHFSFEGYSSNDICEISYNSKTEFKTNLVVIRMTDITSMREAKAELILPQHLQFNLDLIAVDDRLTKEEDIHESSKIGSQYKDYQSKKTTYYSNRDLRNISAMIVASAVSISRP